MDKSIAVRLVAGVVLLAASSTMAYADVHIGVGIGLPVLTPPPVYYGPPPVYYSPPPPVYYGPGVVYGGWNYGEHDRGRGWANDRWHGDHGHGDHGHGDRGHH